MRGGERSSYLPHVFWKTKEVLLDDFIAIEEYTAEELKTYSHRNGLDCSDFQVFTK